MKEFELVCVDEYIFVDICNRRYYIDYIDFVIFYKCICYWVVVGNSFGMYNFLWKILRN